jgi:hypothetical protein
VDYQNIDGLFGAILSEKQATLEQLRNTYTLEDAFILWEVIAVPKFNAWLAAKAAKKEAERK